MSCILFLFISFAELGVFIMLTSFFVLSLFSFLWIAAFYNALFIGLFYLLVKFINGPILRFPFYMQMLNAKRSGTYEDIINDFLLHKNDALEDGVILGDKYIFVRDHPLVFKYSDVEDVWAEVRSAEGDCFSEVFIRHKRIMHYPRRTASHFMNEDSCDFRGSSMHISKAEKVCKQIKQTLKEKNQ